MSTPITEQKILTVNPGRGVAEFSIPCDPATFTGTNGIHFNRQLAGANLLMGIPLAGVYLSNVHGGLGSDANNPVSASGLQNNPNRPAFAGPETTGYYLPPAALANNPAQNGFNNTEKILRSPGDNPAGNGTIWQTTSGRFDLNFSLWISRSPAFIAGLMYTIELYRDLNANDKAAGLFGAGTGPADLQNAVLVQSWAAAPALRNQNMPNFVTPGPVRINAGANLYLLFRASDNIGGNMAVGSIWLS